MQSQLASQLDHLSQLEEVAGVQTAKQWLLDRLRPLPNEMRFRLCYLLPKRLIPPVIMADPYFAKRWQRLNVRTETVVSTTIGGRPKKIVNYYEGQELVKTVQYVSGWLNSVNIYSHNGKYRRYEQYNKGERADERPGQHPGHQRQPVTRLKSVANYIKIVDTGNNYYTNYVLHGRYKEYKKNGRPLLVCNYHFGQLDGHYRKWQDKISYYAKDEKIEQECYYHNGVLHGRYRNEVNQHKMSYLNGQPYGLDSQKRQHHRCYTETGQLIGDYVDKSISGTADSHYDYRHYTADGDEVYRLIIDLDNHQMRLYNPYSGNDDNNNHVDVNGDSYDLTSIGSMDESYTAEANIHISLSHHGQLAITVDGYLVAEIHGYDNSPDDLYGTVTVWHDGEPVADRYGEYERHYSERSGQPLIANFVIRRDRLLSQLEDQLADWWLTSDWPVIDLDQTINIWDVDKDNSKLPIAITITARLSSADKILVAVFVVGTLLIVARPQSRLL